jgi:hypothetical protein
VDGRLLDPFAEAVRLAPELLPCGLPRAVLLELSQVSCEAWVCCDAFIELILDDDPIGFPDLVKFGDKRVSFGMLPTPGILDCGPRGAAVLCFFKASNCLALCAFARGLLDGCGRSLSHFLSAAADGACRWSVESITTRATRVAAPPPSTRRSSGIWRFFRASVHATSAATINAARRGHVEAVRFLLGFGFPAEQIFNALRSACESDEEKVVRMLLETQPILSAGEREGRAPLRTPAEGCGVIAKSKWAVELIFSDYAAGSDSRAGASRRVLFGDGWKTWISLSMWFPVWVRGGRRFYSEPPSGRACAVRARGRRMGLRTFSSVCFGVQGACFVLHA